MEKVISRKDVEGRCPICSVRFHAKTRKAKYCSDGCKQVAYRKRNLKYKDQQIEQDALKKLQVSYMRLENSYYHVRRENFELNKEIRLLKEKVANQ